MAANKEDETVFVLSKVAGAVLMPLSLLVLVGVVGGVLLFLTPFRRTGQSLLVGMVAMLYLLSWEPFASRLLAPLEQRYPPLLDPDELAEQAEVTHIAVLGHGHRLDDRLPVTSQANTDGVTRVLEGVRLQRHFPDSTLVLTGGSVQGPTPNSEVLYQLLQATGLETGTVERLTTPRNTAEEAEAVAELLEDKPASGRVILVSEASHLPRAMGLFRGQGLDPIPAPTRHRVRQREPGADPHPGYALRPTADALRMSERAFHEYLGIAWGRLRGQIPWEDSGP
ncbi:MAG: ElyC/SanA/YdcF family protein [Halorhodospira sp.]